MSDSIPLFQLFLLLGLANAAPILATNVLRDRFAAPLDAGWKLPDGRPLFGSSKTIRGIVISICCTTLVAWALGFDWTIGAILAAASMSGDLASSFIKRRLGFSVHAQVPGLDQVPEALAPLLALKSRLDLSGFEITFLVVAFVFFDVALSYILFSLRIRGRPQ